MRLALIRWALWVSLMVAATGLWLLTGQPGAGLLAGGLGSAAVLFFVVDTERATGKTTDRRRVAAQ